MLKNHPKTTNFRQFPLSFCQKVTKKLQKARKIVNIRKSLCHHLNPLFQKHLTPFFGLSPISPRVHSRPQNPRFSRRNTASPPKMRFFTPRRPAESPFFAQKSRLLAHLRPLNCPRHSGANHLCFRFSCFGNSNLSFDGAQAPRPLAGMVSPVRNGKISNGVSLSNHFGFRAPDLGFRPLRGFVVHPQIPPTFSPSPGAGVYVSLWPRPAGPAPA